MSKLLALVSTDFTVLQQEVKPLGWFGSTQDAASAPGTLFGLGAGWGGVGLGWVPVGLGWVVIGLGWVGVGVGLGLGWPGCFFSSKLFLSKSNNFRLWP